jgi:hypothetical protein
MTAQFEVIEKTIGPVVEIEERVYVWRMPATFTRDYKRIAEYLETHGAECVDMPYARYLDMDWEVELNRGKLATFFSILFNKWHFYAGMPSSRLVPGEAELKSQVLSSQRFVRVACTGDRIKSVAQPTKRCLIGQQHRTCHYKTKR